MGKPVYSDVAQSLPWAKGVKVLKVDANGLLAVEKPDGVMSHPNKASDQSKSLLNLGYDTKSQAYRYEVKEESTETRVYLLNRLDSATSGIVLLALDLEVAQAARAAFEKKQVRKTYQALVFGVIRGGSPLWKDRLSVKRVGASVRASAGGGASAETKLVKSEVIPGNPVISRLTLMPLTGRTHQLRIQTSMRHVPIVGDRTYGDFNKNKILAKTQKLKRLCLHCMGTELDYRIEGRAFRFKASSPVPF